MAEAQETERLQPSMLDRLTDDAPDDRREPRERRVIDVRRLREIILRDLSWLLNTTSKDDMWDAQVYPETVRSTLNYGVIEITGRRAQESRISDLVRHVRTAIEVFEPRILPGTLHVEMKESMAQNRAILSFDIRGEIWAQPIPLEIFMRSELDVTTGAMSVERRG